MKQIDRRALNVLIDHKYVDSSYKDVTQTSKYKHSRAKKYYVKDKLAFIAWDILGDDPDDQEYQRWKKGKNNRVKD